MSKSLRNYPDPMEVFDTYGADAMRWYLLSSPILRGDDFSVTAAGLRDTVRQVLLPLWNAWYFLTLYANVGRAPRRVAPARRGLGARARPLRARQDAPARRGRDDGDGRLRPVRRVRQRPRLPRHADQLVHPPQPERFWAGDQDAIDTLHTVLDVVSRVAAPLLPFVTEEHLRRPAPGEERRQRAPHRLAATRTSCPPTTSCWPAMDQVRDVCSATLSVRKAARPPRAPAAGHADGRHADADALRPFVDIIADEVNVKRRRARPTIVAPWPASGCRSSRRRSGPASGGTRRRSSRRSRPGDWRSTATQVVAGGIASSLASSR